MHRLLTDTAELAAERPSLSTDAIRHLKVLRLKNGERVELFDGCGRTREYVFNNGELIASGAIIEHPASLRGLILFACITKGSRWDWTIEKATELGVTRIVPVISDRTIVRIASDEREAKRARWIRIAEDAARQSDAVWLPEVVAPVDFKAALDLVRETSCIVGALTDPPPPTIGEAVARADASKPLALFVGPEGDFTSEELSALIELGIPASFGPTVLRAETAAIFGVSVLRSHMI